MVQFSFLIFAFFYFGSSESGCYFFLSFHHFSQNFQKIHFASQIRKKNQIWKNLWMIFRIHLFTYLHDCILRLSRNYLKEPFSFLVYLYISF